MQLLARYEADPSLTPTLAYFGCSKKACFLCDVFLALSPLKPRVRGRHGVCHPNWAVSLGPGTAHDSLIELCGVIKGQILRLLQPGPRRAPGIVCQSSAVSELKTADMVHLKRRMADREATEKVATEHRERMQILYDVPGVYIHSWFHATTNTNTVVLTGWIPERPAPAKSTAGTSVHYTPCVNGPELHVPVVGQYGTVRRDASPSTGHPTSSSAAASFPFLPLAPQKTPGSLSGSRKAQPDHVSPGCPSHQTQKPYPGPCSPTPLSRRACPSVLFPSASTSGAALT
jgi:hypothetical protein